MKPDSNMETDRLLHSYARRKRDASMPGADREGVFQEDMSQGQSGSTGHLDADELIAYAENALPVAARSRYTGHLSECDTCRKLVTDLVLSSGVAVQLEAQASTQASELTQSWRDRLAAMFAPRVLRYAAPVILLIGISAIALMVFRGGREPKFTTTQTQRNDSYDNGSAARPSPPKNGEGRERNNNVQTPGREVGEGYKSGSVADAPDRTLKNAPQDGQAEAMKTDQEQGQAKSAAPVTTGTLSGGRKDARDEDASVDQRQQPTFGPDVVEKSKVSKEVARTESTDRAARKVENNYELDGVDKSDDAKIAENKAPATAAKKSARRNREPSPAAPAQGTASDDRKGQAGGAGQAEESRAVSGRQFVRRDGAWVDVAYRSQATTNVKRGSDQYRALVADEPGLRAVANQLGGEVIVVWKGRAYRIH